MAVGTVGSANRRDFKIFQVDSGLFSSVPPGPARLDRLRICREVEGDEEEKVRAENRHASECSKFLAGTFAVVWHIRKIGGSEVGIRRKVDES